MTKPYVSWGRYPYKSQKGRDLHWRPQSLDMPGVFLPQGNARSYGDSCMLHEGTVLSTRFMNRFMAFDAETGIIRCEAGVTLAEILSVVEPQGWFLAVTPGTKFATVGGAIANDVHGKNHHVEGTFGAHLTQFELLRTDGSVRLCSPTENVEWFAATIGGLGLTGLITWAEFKLKRVPNSAVNVENIKYQNLADFFALSQESEQEFEYTVAWVDCLASGDQLGRGHFSRANHARVTQPKPAPSQHTLTIPLDPPVSLVNSASLKAFNWLYYHRQLEKRVTQTTHYDPFFYPLDHVQNWNRMYGPNGFLQYQCVVPMEHSEAAISELLQRIGRANYGSFLAVLKVFGDVPSPALNSFPRPGTTLALDFPYKGAQTMHLFDQLDEVVVQAGGALYPAKDAHMKSEHFKRFYPNADKLESFRDPGINSSFWQRVMEPSK
ncbi:MAG: FAD-binding oxidoreductase [Pseudomonadota bacterium]|nr:FAD-binding oxidoreductase [Pseudomonadota bacterium]